MYISVQFQYQSFQPDPDARGVCKVKGFCFYDGLYFIPFSFELQHDHIQKYFRPFGPTQRVEGVCEERICASMMF